MFRWFPLLFIVTACGDLPGGRANTKPSTMPCVCEECETDCTCPDECDCSCCCEDRTDIGDGHDGGGSSDGCGPGGCARPS